jgi:methylamine dehydrogenase accessory protein MauD
VSEALWVSNALLWVLVVGLAAVVVALTRQVGVLHDRLAPVGALVGGETPRVGETAPVLEVEAWDGAAVRIGGVADDGRDTLLLFVSPTCPVCKELLPVARGLAASGAEGTPRLVLASDGPREEHEAFVARYGLAGGPYGFASGPYGPATYVLSKPLGLSYQIARLPHAVLIDASGTVRARGLVNSREHLESLFEARRRGVASVQDYLSRRAHAGSG